MYTTTIRGINSLFKDNVVELINPLSSTEYKIGFVYATQKKGQTYLKQNNFKWICFVTVNKASSFKESF